ncbi:MAG: hypothetical protein CMK09_04010 [Ponticaulis sp.]|nr:hypothetical protein [Ponticaulis sp.]|tara:strand:- start:4962 stop:6638 length:1677 start_codon:yes stop_codon:yes gene_type:complete
MRNTLTAIAAIFAVTTMGMIASAQEAKPTLEAYAPPEGSFEAFAVMTDKTKLAANVFLPDGEGPWPCIVTRTPYLKDARYANPESAKKYTDAGFAFMVQDVRGKGRSEGFYRAFVDDGPDGYDTIEWMAEQNWCNGKVGITGGSAMGITSNLAATYAPPHLEAAYVVVAPSSRLTGSFIGGAFKEKDSGDWSRRQGIAEEVIAANAANYPDKAYWANGEINENRKYIDIPMYNYGGWYDIFNEGNVRNFSYLQNEGAEGARGNQKLTMGPFGHGPLSGDLEYEGGGLRGNVVDGVDQEIRWFSYWLKGEENGIMDEAPVNAFMMASARKGAVTHKNRWMEFGNWPPAPRERAYYLHADGTLSPDKPEEGETMTYTFDPADPVPSVGGANLTFERGPMDQRVIGDRQDYLRFETAPLDEDVVIAGPVTMNLFAATDGPDTDFMVKLVDVYPDGYEAIVLDSALRTRYRNGRMPDEIEMMYPGTPEEMQIDLWDTAITFEKGHKIQVTVSSSNYPRFDLNPNTGENPAPGVEPRVAENTIYLTEDRPSAIYLPIIYPNGE